MKSLKTSLAVMLTLAVAAAVSAAPEKVKLLCKAQAGQVARYRSQATMAVEFGGNTVNTEMEEVEKVTFTAIAPNGDITVERETETSEATINGMKLPSEPRTTKTTLVIRPNGSLVSVKSTADDPEEQKLTVRMFGATSPVFPDTELSVGSKWSHEFKANTESGQHAAKADYELLAFEKVGGLDAAKIKLTYRETADSPPLASKGNVWVELTSGDTISMDIELENLPFGGEERMVTASGKVRQERIAGGPLGGPKTADGKPVPPKVKTIDDIVKDFEKIPGLFTLYRKKEAGRDTIYLELKEEQLEKLFFLQATASTGTAGAVIAGDPLSDILFKFSKSGDERILMVTPNVNFTAAADSPIARSVKRSFPDGYLDSFKIEAKHPERKSLLINVSDVFRSDVAQLGVALGGYTLDKEKTYVDTLKSFPDNIYVETAYHFMRGAVRPGGLSAILGSGTGTLADPRSIPLRVNFNLFQITDNGYRPRLADPRVGYFYTEYQDFTNDDVDTQMLRYILRWDLEKKDPKAAMSPPKKPITFWMDHAIPSEYRAAVRDGILMWNRAFEKIGIKDAVVVKQMPDDADWDHADMRYNVIRWSTTQSPQYGAIALFRVNPLTGQILNAGITVDASLTRFSKFEKRQEVDPATHFHEKGPDAAHSRNPFRCELAAGALEQAWYGHLALDLLQAPGVKIDEAAYINAYLRAIVAHEMGHILGLFHNFAGSTQFGLEELKDPKHTRTRGVIASVMDYVPFNIAAIKQKDADYWTTTVGPYDIWAVEYGYSAIEGKTPQDELPKLKAIASRCNEPGHAFHNDMEADQFDPLVARFDLGKDPLGYFGRRLQVTRHLLFNLSPRLPRKGESYWEFTRAFNGLINDYSFSAAVASRYIGGLHLNNNFRGDKGEKPTLVPVSGDKQREALRLLNTYIFAENAFSFPAEYYKKLTANPFPRSSGFSSTSRDFPVQNQFSSIQASALRRIMGSPTLRRVANNEFKTSDAERPLTLPELFQSISGSVWSELTTKKDVPALRRQLQRVHLDLLIDMVVSPGNGTPEDARAIGWDQLRQLKAKMMTARQRAGIDDYTRVHLDESLMRIHRALNATQTVGGGGGGGGSLLQLLFGGQKPGTPEPAPAGK